MQPITVIRRAVRGQASIRPLDHEEGQQGPLKSPYDEVPGLHFPKGHNFSDVDKISALIVLEHNNSIGASHYLTGYSFVRPAAEVHFYRFVDEMLRNRLV
jgi:hypothetical protein